ncbi:16S rRNA (cytidine(1402)-2'-O)-methyltransferase [Paragemmobacter straminiformis]|uniref:Ribosomal RNA small subunit methyltransferase I n=1 Tax=Paragemmobacter straminiformis TaxID=2045119 RepID=A0A842I9S7_9RHOB|nr:16S rRNA (cytidine(1402)-2'-O)-methyltransferase [Gemmobacter straminiformis]MBC2836369.1 16S rRNA (cytidine(1402)-2'-O)-methyltransferase [Gemmobacter straminiformis]
MTQHGPGGGSYTIGGKPLAAGLYLVATPIGAARDITLRALDILATADVLAAEDTRTLRHLMEIHGIGLGDRPLVPCHDHNEAAASPRLLRAIEEGKSVAYASEAGTPMVSDPGFPLARAAIAAGLPVIAAPGPSAALCALTVSGLPSDRFLFAGFAPAAAGARRTFLEGLKSMQATVIFYESPKRINQMLEELSQNWGAMRQAALCRELTKRFEEVTRGTLGELVEAYAGRDVKGEIVLLVDRAAERVADTADWEAALEAALERMTVKDAAAMVAEAYDLPRREVYQVALKRGK